MPKSKSKGLGLVHQLADLFGSYIDRPNDPKARGTLNDQQFRDAFHQILPIDKYGYMPEDFGFLQQNPQYRGLRLVLPQSGGSYGEYTNQATYGLGLRAHTQGPIGLPDENDPHNNGILRYPASTPPDGFGLREQVYGELIRRGYPVYGGGGQMEGFQQGFNPVGFGQR